MSLPESRSERRGNVSELLGQYVIKRFASQPSEFIEMKAALDKFNLKCLERHLACRKRERISEQEQIQERTRTLEQLSKNPDIIGHYQFSHIGNVRNVIASFFVRVGTMFEEILWVSKDVWAVLVSHCLHQWRRLYFLFSAYRKQDSLHGRRKGMNGDRF